MRSIRITPGRSLQTGNDARIRKEIVHIIVHRPQVADEFLLELLVNHQLDL